MSDLRLVIDSTGIHYAGQHVNWHELNKLNPTIQDAINAALESVALKCRESAQRCHDANEADKASILFWFALSHIDTAYSTNPLAEAQARIAELEGILDGFEGYANWRSKYYDLQARLDKSEARVGELEKELSGLRAYLAERNER